jgi:hypothetical protein
MTTDMTLMSSEDDFMRFADALGMMAQWVDGDATLAVSREDFDSMRYFADKHLMAYDMSRPHHTWMMVSGVKIIPADWRAD